MREHLLDGRLGVHADAHPELVLPGPPDRLRGIGQGLHVARHHVGAGRLEILEQPVRGFDHQMAVQGKLGVGAKGFDHHRPDRERRDEMSIHDVDVDNVGMLLHGLDLVGQIGEIGREDRRGEPAHGRIVVGAGGARAIPACEKRP